MYDGWLGWMEQGQTDIARGSTALGRTDGLDDHFWTDGLQFKWNGWTDGVVSLLCIWL